MWARRTPHEPSPGTTLIPTSLGRVAVHRRGVGLPAVLWHALWLDSTSWLHVVPALERRRTLFIVDAPGWGESDRLRRTPRASELLRVAAEVIEQVAPGHAVDWVGEGDGGRLGLQVAAEWPHLVRSVAALSPTLRTLSAPARRRLRAMVPVVGAAGPIVVSRPLVRALLTPDAATDPAAVGTVVDALMQARRLSAARSVSGTALGRADLRPLLPRLASPVLLTAGDAMPVRTVRALRSAARGMASGRFELVRGSRALASLEQPRALAALIATLWDAR